MATKLDSSPTGQTSVIEPIDGEIYVRLGSKNLAWRAGVFFAVTAFALSAVAFAGFSELNATSGGKQFQKGATQCPGMTPAQRAATQTPAN